MTAKLVLVLAILGSALSQSILAGGWTRLRTCVAPNTLKSPFDLLLRAGSNYSKYWGDKNLRVILAKSQLVAGQNYLAIFMYKYGHSALYFGIRVYIQLDGTVNFSSVTQITPLLAEVFKGLSMAPESTRDLNCKTPIRVGNDFPMPPEITVATANPEDPSAR